MFEGNTRNNQDILNYLKEQFVDKMVPPCVAISGIGCKYSPENKDQIGCAVGCLLPIEVSKTLDIVGATTISDVHYHCGRVYRAYFNQDQLPFLSACQNFHDNVVYTSDLNSGSQSFRENHLRNLADEFNLEYPE